MTTIQKNMEGLLILVVIENFSEFVSGTRLKTKNTEQVTHTFSETMKKSKESHN